MLRTVTKKFISKHASKWLFISMICLAPASVVGVEIVIVVTALSQFGIIDYAINKVI